MKQMDTDTETLRRGDTENMPVNILRVTVSPCHRVKQDKRNGH